MMRAGGTELFWTGEHWNFARGLDPPPPSARQDTGNAAWAFAKALFRAGDGAAS